MLLKPSEWEVYKTIQLEALKVDPQAFGASYTEWVDFSDEKWQERPGNKNSMIFIAKNGEKPVGLVGVYLEGEKDARVAHIWGMYVSTTCRGKGLGKRLMEKALEAIKNLSKIKKVKLMVEYEPTPAQGLYRSLGFQEAGTTEYALGDGKKHTLFIMEKVM